MDLTVRGRGDPPPGARATIGAVLPLEEAGRAHELVAASEVIGKVVLDPNGLARQ